MRHWKLLMNRYRPEATSMQQKQMFRFLDNDDSGLVDLKELVLRGVDAMDYSFMDIELRKARANEDKGVRLDLRWLFCEGGDRGGSCCEDVVCGSCCDGWNAQHKRNQRHDIDQYFRRDAGGTGAAQGDFPLDGYASSRRHGNINSPYVLRRSHDRVRACA